MDIDDIIRLYEYIDERNGTNNEFLAHVICKMNDLTDAVERFSKEIERLNKVLCKACNIPENDLYPKNDDFEPKDSDFPF